MSMAAPEARGADEAAPAVSSDGERDVFSCPRCGSELLHRSHRISAYERWILPLVGIRPARCESCNLRFYSRKRTAH